MRARVEATAPARRQPATVYFTPETRRRLRVHCAEHDVEISAYVERAVVRLLDLEPRGKR